MLDTTTIQAIARRLHQAEIDRKQIRQVSLDHPDITIDDAYAIQREWVAMKLAEAAPEGPQDRIDVTRHAAVFTDRRAGLRRAA